MFRWLKSLFAPRQPHPRDCIHTWEIVGRHTNHPAFEYKGEITFLKCPNCDSRRIEQGNEFALRRGIQLFQENPPKTQLEANERAKALGLLPESN